MSCLARHPEVATAGAEMRVHPLFTRGVATFTVGSESWPERLRCNRALFNALALSDDSSAIRAHGMKLALSRPDEAADLANSLREYFDDLRVVVMRREDLVAQVASLHRARRTGVWHSWQGEVHQTAFDLPLDEFVDQATTSMRIDAQLRTLRHTHAFLELVYERTVAVGQWSSLFAFLGVADVDPVWMSMRKVAPLVSDYVANHAELRDALRGIPEVSEAEELALAEARADAALHGESTQLLVSRAREALESGRHAEAERVAIAALLHSEPVVGTRRAATDVLRTAWERLGSSERALAGVRRLEAAGIDDAELALLAGIVRCHAGQRDVGLADMKRALRLDPGFERARQLLHEWQPRVD